MNNQEWLENGRAGEQGQAERWSKPLRVVRSRLVCGWRAAEWLLACGATLWPAITKRTGEASSASLKVAVRAHDESYEAFSFSLSLPLDRFNRRDRNVYTAPSVPAAIVAGNRAALGRVPAQCSNTRV